MTENEMIEVAEMAVLGCKRTPKCKTIEGCMDCEFHPHSCNQWQLAESAINAGYRKPDGAVVISKDEYYDLIDKIGFNAIKQLAEIGDAIEQARKEIATEILKAVDDESYGQTSAITRVLRKRYGVEVEE